MSHVRDTFRKINNDSWIIAGKLLLSRTQGLDCTWRDAAGDAYQITDAPNPLPDSQALDDDDHIKIVYDAGDVSAVFAIGNLTLCKVRVVEVPQVTREHVTLSWMQQKEWSFSIPSVLHYTEFDGRYYMFLSRVPGETLDNLWPSMEEATRQHCIERIANICAEMALPSSRSTLTGVDGNFLPEFYLCGRDLDCSPDVLKRSSEILGMDCTKLVFYHCDLGPTNVLYDAENDKFGIIDWEIAGYVPVEWIRTKFRVSSGMDLSKGDGVAWRRSVGRYLGTLGYSDVSEEFMDWLRSKR